MTRRLSILLALVALASLLPAGAAAQQQVDQLKTSVNRTVLGSKDCNTLYQVTVEASVGGQGATGLGDRWSVRVGSDENCSGGKSFSKTVSEAVGTAGSYQFTLKGAEIFSAVREDSCPGESGIAETAYVCAIWSNEGGSEVKSGAKVEIDTAGPGRPQLSRVSPGDRSLHLRFQPASGASSPAFWEVCWRRLAGGAEELSLAAAALEDGEAAAGGAGGEAGVGEGADGESGLGGAGGAEDPGSGGMGGVDGTGGSPAGSGEDEGEGGAGAVIAPPPSSFTPDSCKGSIGGSSRGYHLTGLRNGLRYEVAVRATDDKGNRSDFSAAREGTPQPIDDFWKRYKDAGGDEEGGCSAGSGTASLGLLFAALFASRRLFRR